MVMVRAFTVGPVRVMVRGGRLGHPDADRVRGRQGRGRGVSGVSFGGNG